MTEQFTLDTQCGFVAIVGRPNVGKSTLMNHLLGQKISITSRKPQTTRHQITGIWTEEQTQIVFVDTPGMHRGQEKAINRVMNKAADSALNDVDAVLMVVDRTVWSDEDQWVLDKLDGIKAPVILIINKVDHLENKQSLLPHLEQVNKKYPFADVIPVSALQGHNLDTLIKVLSAKIPAGLFHFPEDQVTDRSQRFMAAEIIREKIMRQLGAELPYSTAVEIEQFEFEDRILHIHGLILVERSGQKRIVIGDKGERIKKVGQEARVDMENLFETKVMLNLWVKVKGGWADDERALKSLGYYDQ
ncbi:MAG: GTPase Era [Reinekea forsetii]|jgi:GTP-binding protein Era|uniref:GTPase Era n=1 Tax=Reinekea forsetii TaxID=1336806 RepID=A0A2K8KRK0_9GAMM|nr:MULTISPECIES: GTPase Era [Reinekea]ATX77355.1 GTP-binding protein Era [Reinekea forsetii]MDO7641606.1 GTPase Era [Reinekea forsetii]MDO7643542.1 GTPase Era [Reinekea forsetii]MDO7673680.1 GTPase Era [Reinekea forsetii]